jgi:hypothetical protein
LERLKNDKYDVDIISCNDESIQFSFFKTRIEVVVTISATIPRFLICWYYSAYNPIKQNDEGYLALKHYATTTDINVAGEDGYKINEESIHGYVFYCLNKVLKAFDEKEPDQ